MSYFAEQAAKLAVLVQHAPLCYSSAVYLQKFNWLSQVHAGAKVRLRRSSPCQWLDAAGLNSQDVVTCLRGLVCITHEPDHDDKAYAYIISINEMQSLLKLPCNSSRPCVASDYQHAALIRYPVMPVLQAQPTLLRGHCTMWPAAAGISEP